MNKEQIKQLKTEFGIHFRGSPNEFGFLISFIDDLLEKQKKELREKIEKMKKEIKYEELDTGIGIDKLEYSGQEKEHIYNQAIQDLNQLLK